MMMTSHCMCATNYYMLLWLAYCLFGALLSIVTCRAYAFFARRWRSECTVAFFHPYCNSGGGGERVLWLSILALHRIADASSSTATPLRCIVYTGDCDVTPFQILEKVNKQFKIAFQRPIAFIYLRLRFLVTAQQWPRLTLLGQSIGSMILAAEALFRAPPNIFFDSTGYAFSYVIAKVWFGCTVVCYTHYPQISTDMLQRVQERRPTYNNDTRISNSVVASFAKLWYYKAFALLYGFVGQFSDLIMVNSSWTRDHINSLWGSADRTCLVYPPCPTQHLVSPTSLTAIRRPLVISVSQFRPEKDHELQIIAFARFLASDFVTQRRQTAQSLRASNIWQADSVHSAMFESASSSPATGCPPCLSSGSNSKPVTPRARRSANLVASSVHSLHSNSINITPSPFAFDGRPKLCLIGGCRDAADEARVANLKRLATSLGIANDVEFHVNVDNQTLGHFLASALVVIHTMWNEHFGISCVEAQASGAVLLAHNSGGPRQDIAVVVNDTRSGFLASDAAEYAANLEHIFSSYFPPFSASVSTTKVCRSRSSAASTADAAILAAWRHQFLALSAIRSAAQTRSHMFSDECFIDRFCEAFRRVYAF